jgi:hypothetical protein
VIDGPLDLELSRSINPVFQNLSASRGLAVDARPVLTAGWHDTSWKMSKLVAWEHTSFTRPARHSAHGQPLAEAVRAMRSGARPLRQRVSRQLQTLSMADFRAVEKEVAQSISAAIWKTILVV